MSETNRHLPFRVGGVA